MTEQTKPIEQKPEAGIQQLNLSYNKEQDRLLFRVGLSDNTELDLWFTYNFSRQLWKLLNGETHLPEAKSFQSDGQSERSGELPENLVQQFKQEAEATEALQKLDFATEYQPRKELRNDAVMLAISLKLSDDGEKHLDIACLEGVSVRMNLTHELTLALCNMLQLSAKEASWDIGAPSSPVLTQNSTSSQVLH